jgi:hypothetical protein
MRWIVPLLLAVAPAQSALADSVYNSSSDRLSYVLFTGNDDSAMMSGSTDDVRRARALRSGAAPLLYVREDGAAYVIRDPALLRRAEEIMRPQRELGDRQGELGRQQGELGRRQGALGAEQGRLGRMMADARVRELDELSRQQSELGRQQAALGTQQSELGRRQAELGRQQERAAEAARPQFRALINEALQRGVAQRVN